MAGGCAMWAARWAAALLVLMAGGNEVAAAAAAPPAPGSWAGGTPGPPGPSGHHRRLQGAAQGLPLGPSRCDQPPRALLTTSRLDVTPVVVFSELMYHPDSSEAGDAGEWLELRNVLSVDVDITRWQLTGAVRHTFPSGTRIPGGGYLVVRAEDSGLSSPHVYSGHLSNGGERVNLHNNAGRLMDAVKYDDDDPWPALADGSGLSLAKLGLLPSWDAESWGASRSRGGTPGAENGEALRPDSTQPMLNEVSAAGPGCWAEIKLSPPGVGYSLAVAGQPSPIPLTTGSGPSPDGLMLARCDELGLSLEAGDLLLLLDPSAEILDGVRVEDVVKARAADTTSWGFPAFGTPGSANAIGESAVIITNEVIINEVMYQAPPSVQPAEWIELRNAGSSTVDLQGWQLTRGIGYEFVSPQPLPPGGLLLVVSGSERPPGTPADAVVLGPWKGSLANKGDVVQLLDRCGNVADEASYSAGGALWPEAASGGGASLERRHADSPGKWPESWAAKLPAQLSWQTVSYSQVSAPSAVGPDTQWSELVIGLLAPGEVLL